MTVNPVVNQPKAIGNLVFVTNVLRTTQDSLSEMVRNPARFPATLYRLSECHCVVVRLRMYSDVRLVVYGPGRHSITADIYHQYPPIEQFDDFEVVISANGPISLCDRNMTILGECIRSAKAAMQYLPGLGRGIK